MEMIFHSHANKTHFHKKGCAPSLIFESEGFWNSEVAYYTRLNPVNTDTNGAVLTGCPYQAG